MPSVLHEAACQLLKRNPLLGPYLAASTGYPIPAGPVIQADSNLSDDEPREKRADAVLVTSAQRTKLVLISEVQTSRPKCAKRRSWVCYIGNAGSDHDCDAVLVVIAFTTGVARSCARPFATGHPEFVLKVIVIGPRNTPHPETLGAEAVALELTVLNVLNGNFDLGDAHDRRYVLDTLSKADKERRRVYTRFIYLTATRAVRTVLEEDLATTYRVDFIDRPFEMAEEAAQKAEEATQAAQEATQAAQEATQAAARILLRLLTARGFEVADSLRKLIESCNDVTQLGRWADSAATATTLEQIFGLATASRV